MLKDLMKQNIIKNKNTTIQRKNNPIRNFDNLYRIKIF
jgi:hypothetical protein